MTAPRLLAFLVTLAVLAAVIAGFFVAGSPAKERARRFDQQRTQDLMQIENAVDFYASQHESVLPTSLDQMDQRPLAGPTPPRNDPETGAPYEYHIKDAKTYELCAVFVAVTDSSASAKPAPPYYPSFGNFWDHGVGRTCFAIHPVGPTGLQKY